MSLSLRERWLKQLDAALTDPSWRAQAEVRVLRFLLARYEGKGEEAKLVPFPVYEGESPHGRAHLPLSRRQMGERLKHIAKIDQERAPDKPTLIDWDGMAYHDTISHQRREARRERFRTRRERGYW